MTFELLRSMPVFWLDPVCVCVCVCVRVCVRTSEQVCARETEAAIETLVCLRLCVCVCVCACVCTSIVRDVTVFKMPVCACASACACQGVCNMGLRHLSLHGRPRGLTPSLVAPYSGRPAGRNDTASSGGGKVNRGTRLFLSVFFVCFFFPPETCLFAI